MAKRPSIQEILEQARKGGPAKPRDESSPAAEPTSPLVEAADIAASGSRDQPAPVAAQPLADVPSPAKLGRPLTLQEKLAAARAGVATKPETPKATAAPVTQAAPSEPVGEPSSSALPKAPIAPAPSGRPLTLQEKLAAARAGATAPSGGVNPASAKPVTAAAKPTTADVTRVLPPLEKITDPRDLAEALRQTGAKKAKESTAKASPAASAAGKPPTAAKPGTVLPKPSKQGTAAHAQAERRGFLVGSLFISWIWVAWTTFTAGVLAFTGMLGRFMFPNVLAEPPSTVKVGLPTNYEPEEVNERFKADWGFWIVRSTRYNGQDVLYALQTVCTHLGCPPNWLANEQKFKCPCHGSGFYITGINFEGPAPRPLERFKVTLADDGQILVDKSQKFQQELGQWSDPDSYIAV